MADTDDGDEVLTVDQKEMVVRFLMACPEMRDHQVRDWSERYPDLAWEFETTAELFNARREEIERARSALSDEEAGRRFQAGVDRLFSGSRRRLRAVMLH